ncbi:MAG: hypothetical protein LBF09_03930, partial [Odoribacteraceae bacterium]|nr:hypothetical protein [Odoribacteraceae bacterium]
EHVLSCREHVLSCREHVLSCREHVLSCREHVLSCREHVPSRREHVPTPRGHVRGTKYQYFTRRVETASSLELSGDRRGRCDPTATRISSPRDIILTCPPGKKLYRVSFTRYRENPVLLS